MHSRKSILLHNRSTWVKKDDDGMFDVKTRSLEGTEVCELDGHFISNNLSNKYRTNNIRFYRDDGLATFKNTERTRREITRHFKEHGLKITIQSNLKSLDYLNITINLTNWLLQPYRKPNDEPLYINTKSNHPYELHVDLSVSFRNGYCRWILCEEGSIYSFSNSLQGSRRTTESIMTKLGIYSFWKRWDLLKKDSKEWNNTQ